MFVVVWDLFFPSPLLWPMAGRPAEFAADQPRCLSVKGAPGRPKGAGGGCSLQISSPFLVGF